MGRVARAHGNKGHVIVNPETDFAVDRFAPGTVLMVEQGGRVSERRIEAVRFQAGRPIIAFDGIETMSGAEALAGAELKVRQADLPPLASGTYYRHDLVGCEVTDTAGALLGRVTRVEGPLERSLLVIATRRGEALIPMVEGIVLRIDLAAKAIVVDLPEGLVDLNAPPVNESE
ncbi:MAG: ribosome maturation factor RimM [Vicinamibacterales bacterium]